MAEHFILLSVLLLSLFAFSVSGQVFWSVNCGASYPYIDHNTISWTPDTSLVSNGVARSVRPSLSIDPVLDTLRVFTTRKKNCYSTPVTRGGKLLVRASFYYGNYDQLLSPPTFDLHFDGNFWTTVQSYNTVPSVYEATYVAKGDTISVCVAQTKSSQFPFISALEVRSVNSDVYSVLDKDRALFLVSRSSYGSSGTLRFPQDPYDRKWLAASAGTEKVTNDAIVIDPTGTNNPPEGIFEHAITTNGTTKGLLLWVALPSTTPVYMTWYFSEVSNPAITRQTRSFRFVETTVTGSVPVSLSVSPPYGTMIERQYYNYTVDTITATSLFATSYSDLPPLLNAYEVFNISGVLTDGTNRNDVAALALLQTAFEVLGEWSGDPCLPAPYSWDWLDCSIDTPPRVTSLYLNGYELSGSLPDISSMDALKIIDLHNNSLTGGVPNFLGFMPNLQQLNLADNNLSGPIPASLSNNNKLELTVTGNPFLCTSGKSCSTSSGTVNSSPRSTNKKKKSSKLPLILGIAIPSFFLILVSIGIFIIFNKKKNAAIIANMPIATGHTVAGANGKPSGGANGNSHEQPNIGQ